MAEVYLGFGSNLGNRKENLKQAIKLLADHPKISVEKISSIYESAPVEMESTHKFLNGVVKLQTFLVPLKLTACLQEIEERLGRPKKEKGQKQDRTIDLDVLFYNDLVFSVPSLTVPHPQAHRREFVLLPMLELAPDFEHPYYKVPLRELLEKLASTEKIDLCPNLTISP